MKRTLFLLLTITILSLFSGCSNDNITPPYEPQVSITNPFEQNEIPEGTIVQGSYGFGLNTVETTLTYDGGLTVPIMIENAEVPITIGVLVYMDGIVQPYTSNLSDELTILQTYSLEANSTNTFELYPQVEVDDYSEPVVMHLRTVFMPNYMPPEDFPNFGNYHNGTTFGATEIKVNSDMATRDYKMLEENNLEVIDESLAEILRVERLENISPTFALMPKNTEYTGHFVGNADGSLSVQLYSYCTQNGGSKYRVSFYKNHQKIKFNGDYEYLDVDVKSGFFSVTDVVFDDVNVGDFVYCVAVPLTDLQGYAEKSQSIMVVSPEHYKEIVEAVIDNEILPPTDNNVKSQTPPTISSATAKSTSASFDEFTHVLPQISDSLGRTIYTGNKNNRLYLFAADKDQVVINSVGLPENAGSIKIKFCDEKVILLYKEGAVSNSQEDVILLNQEVSNAVYGLIFDMNLNQIASYDFSSISSTIQNTDINSNILCFAEENKLYKSDLSLNNKELLFELSGDIEKHGVPHTFTAIALVENYVVFSAIGNEGSQTIQFYGAVNLNDKSKNVYRKDGLMDTPKIADESVIWGDARLVPSKTSSGEIATFKDGIFSIIKTVTPNESQLCYNSRNGKVVTLSDSVGSQITFRVYTNGVLEKEFTENFGEKVNIENVVVCDDYISLGYAANGVHIKIIEY